jgi:hypothetical protein
VTPLTRFWQAAETLCGLATVTAEWRALLGPEYELARPLLRPRGHLATSFPRLPPPVDGLPYRVVTHGPDDHVGVCGETGETIALSRRDLVVYEVNRPLLAERVVAALGLHRDGADLAPRGTVERVGTYAPPTGQMLSAFLAYPLESADLHAAAAGLAAEGFGPFLLLAPTRRRLGRRTEALLAAHGSVFVALSEVLTAAAPGRFCAIAPWDTIVHGTAHGPQPTMNVFRWDGDGWTLTYERKTVTVGNLRGMRYIAQLLVERGREIHAAMLRITASSQGPIRVGIGCDILDDRIRADCTRRYEDLQHERELAVRNDDKAKLECIDTEIHALACEVSAATGLGGRHRRMGDEAERARKAVCNAITRAIAAIGRKHRALGRHLDNSVRTGAYCCYAPEGDVDWAV